MGSFQLYMLVMGLSFFFLLLGFAKTNFKVPDTLTENRYSLIQILNHDTRIVNQAVIYPHGLHVNSLNKHFDLKVPDTDMDHARRNLALETKRREHQGDMDGSMNGKFVYQNNSHGYIIQVSYL